MPEVFVPARQGHSCTDPTLALPVQRDA